MVAVAAGVTVAVHAVRTNAVEGEKTSQDYSGVIPVVATGNAVKAADVEGGVAPLKTLAELNVLATNTEAVFVVIPSTDGERTAAIQKEVKAAAVTITARGTKIGTFILSRDAQEYAGVVKQVGAPAVLAMVKGRGMAAVNDKEITQEGLLKGFVGASRPSGCGPSSGGCGTSSGGCGPSSAGCK